MGRPKKVLPVQNEENNEEKNMQTAPENVAKDTSGDFGVSTPDTSREDLLNQQKAYDNVMVTGKFLNQRAPGQQVRLTYHKYASDPVKWYDFKHNSVYTIPRGFADQINDHYAKLIFTEGEKTGTGKEIVTRTDGGFTELLAPRREQIYAFVPVSF